jgi:adenine-specific DNA-methyltransferase
MGILPEEYDVDVGTTLPESGRAYQAFPQLRYMGSKYRLLGWIAEELSSLRFDTAIDAFSGSGAVSYLLKTLGKKVFSNDFLHFSYIISKGAVENSATLLSPDDVGFLLSRNRSAPTFIQDTFRDIFFVAKDLRFLDEISANIRAMEDPYKRALALACLLRSCVKKQPRGVFTVSGDPRRYDDGRRDLKLTIREHFLEQVDVYNNIVFDNGTQCLSFNCDVMSFDQDFYKADLVYLDPPYVPRSDDNCYVKRYHFLEGLSKYWENEEILLNTKVRKTPLKKGLISSGREFT